MREKDHLFFVQKFSSPFEGFIGNIETQRLKLTLQSKFTILERVVAPESTPDSHCLHWSLVEFFN